ncbi:MAG TPA: FMN-binding negative transcriptional regulator, partial [Terriglobia bacterium]|nr:FMN-binding negative transcriptional regulator [Terriglobia bacterium]
PEHRGPKLYIPELNRLEDTAVALRFMRANPFAVLISAGEGSPFATHIPVLVAEAAGGILLRGHVARANPHWEMLEQERETLTIFHGPHAYISPSLYGSRESVPTWNYVAVHAYGRARVFHEADQLTDVLLESITVFEQAYLEQWRGLNENYRAKMLSQIVGFEIAVERLEAKFKLSQNRPRADQARVIQSLESSADSAISGVARLMKDHGLGQ